MIYNRLSQTGCALYERSIRSYAKTSDNEKTPQETRENLETNNAIKTRENQESNNRIKKESMGESQELYKLPPIVEAGLVHKRKEKIIMKVIDKINFTPFLIFCANIILGVLIIVWYPGEVPSPIINVGGSSAIFFLFLAKSNEERSISLLSFIGNNLLVFYLFNIPDLYCFLVGVFLILVSSFHLYLWVSYDVFLHLTFFAVLLSRIFYHNQMGEWGFGLVTELMFLRLFIISFELFIQKEDKDRSEEGSRIEPLLFLLPLFTISFFNLLYYLDIKELLIHMNFLIAAAALIFFSFISETLRELKISILLYIICNLSIGFLLANNFMTFLLVSLVYLITNGIFASLFLLKAQRSKRPLADILFANNREGIQILLVIYIVILGLLLTQLMGSDAHSKYYNWVVGLGFQIGFLAVLNFFI